MMREITSSVLCLTFGLHWLIWLVCSVQKLVTKQWKWSPHLAFGYRMSCVTWGCKLHWVFLSKDTSIWWHSETLKRKSSFFLYKPTDGNELGLVAVSTDFKRQHDDGGPLNSPLSPRSLLPHKRRVKPQSVCQFCAQTEQSAPQSHTFTASFYSWENSIIQRSRPVWPGCKKNPTGLSLRLDTMEED